MPALPATRTRASLHASMARGAKYWLYLAGAHRCLAEQGADLCLVCFGCEGLKLSEELLGSERDTAISSMPMRDPFLL